MWILSRRFHQKPAALDPRFYKKGSSRVKQDKVKILQEYCLTQIYFKRINYLGIVGPYNITFVDLVLQIFSHFGMGLPGMSQLKAKQDLPCQ